MLSLSDKYPSLRFIVALLREIQSGKGSIKFNQPAKWCEPTKSIFNQGFISLHF